MHLYHYVSLNGSPTDEYRRDLIARRRIYFSDPSTFDDTFDCNVPGWESAKGKLRNCRVFCLSMEERDDNLMFALYGDHHRGIRLRFTINQDLAIGECTTLARGRPVQYVDGLPPYDENRPHMYYYYKSASWKYQSEYRVLITNGCHGEYSESELTEIALGLKFDVAHLHKLAEWVQEGRHSRVSFKKAVSCSNAFGCVYETFLV
jgi:hypothetical protein